MWKASRLKVRLTGKQLLGLLNKDPVVSAPGGIGAVMEMGIMNIYEFAKTSMLTLCMYLMPVYPASTGAAPMFPNRNYNLIYKMHWMLLNMPSAPSHQSMER